MVYIFETEHLKVRTFLEEDAQALFENHLEDAVQKWIPNESYADVEEAGKAIRFYADCVKGGHLPYVLAVEQKETGELIGDIGVNETEGNPNEVEIGYSICVKYSSKGYATELLQAMTRYITSVFKVDVLYGRVIRGNQASVRVLEKSGYIFLTEEFDAPDDPYGKGMLVYKKEITHKTESI